MTHGKILAFTIFVIFSPASGEELNPKRIRVGANYGVPLAYLAPDGTPAGFFTEVMREAGRREGLDVEIVMRRDSVDSALATGAVDLWAGAVATEERRRKFYFTDPWWSLDHYLVVMESSSIRNLEDVARKTVAFTDTPPFSIDLRSVLSGATLKRSQSLRDRFSALCAGEVDAVLFYQETALFSITGANDFVECRQRGMRVIPIQRPILQLSVVSQPAGRQLADRFRNRIGEMMREGSISKLPSFRMTGDNSMVVMLQAERSQSRQQILQISLAFAIGLMLLSVVAYARLRLANARVVQALDLAKRAAQAKGEFLALMSHEIRTPMTAVLGYMDMLLSTPLRHDQRQFAIEVSQATASLLTMLTAVLDYSRSLGATSPPQRVEFDPAAVIDDSVSGILLQAESKGLDVTVRLNQNLPSKLLGDPMRIRHMVSNLATNAVKFTERGWIHIEAGYRRHTPGAGVLEVSVADSGIGITREKQKVIFLPFTQVDSSDSRPAEGIGLGLAIVSDLAKQLNGSVSVESELGMGSRFTLNVPAEPAEGSVPWFASLRQSGEAGAVLLSKSSRQVTILEEYLTEAGFRMKRTHTLSETKDELHRAPVGAVVLCMVSGPEHGEAAAAAIAEWKRQSLIRNASFVLLGSMQYLSGPGQHIKATFDRVLPLPAGRRSLSEATLPQSAPRTLVPLSITRPVLVVDDNPVNRRVLSALLEKLGCEVETAINGSEALTKALQGDYQLILMDCQMPEMNGYEATEAIRRDPVRGADIRICGLSAAVDPEVRTKCLAAGMNDYIPKPVTLDSLRELVSRFNN